MSSDPTRYPPIVDYVAELKVWGIRAAVVVALTVLTALVNRYFGVSVEVPPPPPVTVVVQPQDGAPPTVTVFQGTDIGTKP